MGNSLRGLCKNQTYRFRYGEMEIKGEHLLFDELDFLETTPISFLREFKFLF
jgi:hypothetical protein